jgi:hypothetical protein
VHCQYQQKMSQILQLKVNSEVIQRNELKFCSYKNPGVIMKIRKDRHVPGVAVIEEQHSEDTSIHTICLCMITNWLIAWFVCCAEQQS